MAVGPWIYAAATLLPYLFKNQDTRKTGFEGLIEDELKNIIQQGGVGLTDEQLKGRYDLMAKKMTPVYRRMRASNDVNLARRGIWNSGLASTSRQNIDKSQASQLADIWQQLIQGNEDRKMQSYMSALGLGGRWASGYGDIERYGQAQNQAAMMQMWANLLKYGQEKGWFDF